jgi:voltage-gated potassium channel
MQARVLRRSWDLLIGLLVTFEAITLPADLVFRLSLPVYVLELLATLLLGIDFLVRLRASDGSFRSRTVLLCDLLAALPLGLATGSPFLHLFRLLKLVRLIYLVRAWGRHQVMPGNLLRLVFFCYGLLLVAHWISCGWAALRDTPTGTDSATRYLQAVYWCIQTLATVGYGDVTPQNNAQTLYTIGVMLLGVGIYAYLIGNIATLLTQIDPIRTRYREQVEQMAAFMHYRRLPRPLQERIRHYLDYRWQQRLGYEEATLLALLPPSLQAEVTLHLKRDLIEKVPLFQGASEAFIREVALEMQPVVYLPGDVVVRAGERGRDMFFISQGRVEVRSPDGQTVYNILDEGDFFGEVALFFQQPRTATVSALAYCDLYRLDHAMYERVRLHHPDIAAQIEARARQRYAPML